MLSISHDKLNEEADKVTLYGASTEAYDAEVEALYTLIYDSILFNDDIDFKLDDNYPLRWKEIIVQYLNPENYYGVQDINDFKKPVYVNDEIKKALSVLEKYQTPEYDCLSENGFCNSFAVLEKYQTPEYDCLSENGFCKPFVKREKHESFTFKNWEMKYRKNFIERLVTAGASKNQAKNIEKSVKNIDAF